MSLNEWLDIHHWLNAGLSLFMDLVFLAIVFTLLELVRPIQKDITFDQEKRTELAIFILTKLLVQPFFITLHVYGSALALKTWLPYQAFDDEIRSLPLFLQIVFGLLILDAATYIRHRFMHEYLWKVHAIHHSAVHINWLTSLRLHPIEIGIAIFFDMTVLYLLGFSGDGMVYAATAMALMNVIAHANINLEWPGFLRYCFGSPNFHRWHHAKQEKKAYDKNYCVVFPFIDIALGTFYYPEKKLPKSYGIYQRKGELPLDSSFVHQMTYPFVSRK